MSAATFELPPSAPIRYLRADRIGLAADTVPHRGGDAVGVLRQRQVLGREARLRAARAGGA